MVGFVAGGIFVIEGLAYRNALVVVLIECGVNIGDQTVPEPEGCNGFVFYALMIPGLLAQHGTAAVQPQDGGKYTELEPAQIELVIFRIAHVVTADIVGPMGIADVGSGVSKIGLEIQSVPGDSCITAEAQRIPVGPDACIPGKDQRTLAVFGQIQGVVVVADPQRVQSRPFAPGTLLPVDPPEIHAVRLVGLVQDPEIGIQEIGIGTVEGNSLAVGLFAHGGTHLRILVFKRADAAGRMKVNGNAQILLFQLFQEGLVVGEQVRVPAVAGPAGGGRVQIRFLLVAEFFLYVYPVPVHIDGGHSKGDIRCYEPVHQIQIFLLGVGIVPGPPVAQGKARHHGRRAGDVVVQFQCPPVILGGKAVEVLFHRTDLAFTVRIQNQTPVLHYGHTVAADDALLQREGTHGPVQGPVGSFQIVPVVGSNPVAVQFHEVDFLQKGVDIECCLFRLYHQMLALGVYIKLPLAQITEPDGLGGLVQKSAPGIKFHPDQLRGKDGDPGPAADVNLIRICFAAGLCNQMGIQLYFHNEPPAIGVS